MIFYLPLTVIIYFLCVKVNQKYNFALLNPVLISIIILISILIIFEIEYATYNQYNQLLTDLLQPAVVALGIPLYKQLSSIKSELPILLIFISISITISTVIVILLTIIIGSNPEIIASLAPKSITTPIAVLISKQTNGNPALSAIAVIITGLVGAIVGIPILNLLKIKSKKARGLAMGTISHALGTAKITQEDNISGAYSAFALIISASVSAIICPIIVPFFIKLFSHY